MDIQRVLGPGEKPIWMVKPNPTVFIFLSSILRAPVFTILFSVVGITIASSKEENFLRLLNFSALQYAIGALLILFIVFIVTSIIHSNTVYILTKDRLILRSGFLGVDTQSIELNRITDLELNVGPIDKFFQTGSIFVFTANSGHSRRLAVIDQPHQVLASIREAQKAHLGK